MAGFGLPVYGARRRPGILIAVAGAGFLFSDRLIGLPGMIPRVMGNRHPGAPAAVFGVGVLPFTMAVEMLYQSTGHRLGASLLSSARGLFFYPLADPFGSQGLSGIQESAALAYIPGLSAVPLVRFPVYALDPGRG